MKEINISPRLLSAADFVRQDAVLADIGTDHAYLPLFLLRRGRIRRAFCSDINEGPLVSAKNNVALAGFTDRVEFTLADGADALSGKGITDYTICGMGGELIADIVERAEEMRDPRVRLILQPMTRRGILAASLYKSGFEILEEAYSKDAGKHYVTLLVAFSGKCRKIGELEAEFGIIDTPCRNSDARIGYLRSKLAVYEKRRAGIEQSVMGGEDYAPHIEYIKKLIELEERREK
jgi:tRNA (adenine22-N1)-methyltransferase